MTMSQPQRDTFDSGIGVLYPTDDGAAADPLQDNEPIRVNGVALPVDTPVEGGQGERHFYPPEVLESAADRLEGANIVKNFHDLEGQAPAEDVIGEVTEAAYSDGVGLVYEGEIIDQDIAERVQQGYLDVSPTVARALGEADDTLDARRVETVAGFRDLAVVQQGQPGAEINLGSNPGLAALSYDALARAFDRDDGSDPGDADPEATPGDDGADGSKPQSTDGPSGTDPEEDNSMSQKDDTELTDAERELLARVDDPEGAIDVLAEYERREEPRIVEQSEWETLEAETAEARTAFAAILADDSPMSADALAESSMDALTEPFRDDDGNLQVDTLRQEPETGEPDAPTDDGDDPDDPMSVDSLSLDERDSLQQKRQKITAFENRGMPGRADTLRAEIAEMFGADEYDDVEPELEAL